MPKRHWGVSAPASLARGPGRLSGLALPAVAHLPACRQAVRFQAGGQYRQPWGRRPYLVECTEPAWQLRARVEVTLMLPVWVAARDIPKGHVIAPEDLLEKSLDASRLQRGFTHSSQPLAGSKSLRHLRMGQLIGELDLQQAWAVRAGEGVLIRVGQPGFSATTRGTALSNGAIGEGVRVRNLSSGKEIQAWVVDKGKSKPAFSAEMASLIQVRPPQGRLSQRDHQEFTL